MIAAVQPALSSLLGVQLLLLLGSCASHPAGDVQMLQRVAPMVVAIANQRQTIASGFFVAPHLIMTNHHVLQQAPLFFVSPDGEYVALHQVSADQDLDVAVLEVKRRIGRVALTFREDLPSVGVKVFAIGNPFGAGITTTMGIISAQPKAIGKAQLLQTDASINPGNSGGPLVDEQGEVVGIVTSRGSVGSGIGFAVPAEALVPLLRRAMQP